MSKQSNSIGITHQAGKGWKKCIGWYAHADGRRLPKIHWLGHDEEHARYLAFTLQKRWSLLDAQGLGWTPEEIAGVKAFVAGGADFFREPFRRIDAQQAALDARRQELQTNTACAIPGASAPAAAAESPAPEASMKRPMLYAAIAAYVASIKGKRMSDKHKQRAQQVVEVNLKRVRKDCPLADVDFAWIDALCDHFKNRPANLKDGKPLAPAGVKNILTYLRLFFQWLDDASWGGWEAPRKLLKPFKVRIDDMMTPVELRASGAIKQFDLDTLKALYKAATDRQRAVMLAALFTGATQQELAVLEKSEFDLEAGALHHFRNKTKVEGRYWLPPELVMLLKADWEKRAKDALAFRTADGNALVTFKDGKQTSDAVRQMWDDLREEAERPDALSFKYLRKYLADWTTRAGGEAMGQIALSHSRKTVLAKNYTSARDFEAFNELQRKMHAEFTAAGMFTVPVKAEKAKDAKPARAAKARGKRKPKRIAVGI
jgi:integrase